MEQSYYCIMSRCIQSDATFPYDEWIRNHTEIINGARVYIPSFPHCTECNYAFILQGNTFSHV